jgi:hypothetical protein
MSDYTTHEESLGGKALVVAAALIGLLILVLAFMGANSAPEIPASFVDQNSVGGAATTD